MRRKSRRGQVNAQAADRDAAELIVLGPTAASSLQGRADGTGRAPCQRTARFAGFKQVDVATWSSARRWQLGRRLSGSMCRRAAVPGSHACLSVRRDTVACSADPVCLLCLIGRFAHATGLYYSDVSSTDNPGMWCFPVQPVKVLPCLIAACLPAVSDLSARLLSSFSQPHHSTFSAPFACIIPPTTATVAVACPGTFGRP